MNQARALADRTAVAGRRLTGAPDWPLIAATALGLGAMVQVMGHVVSSDDNLWLSFGVLAALGGTAPLALVRASPPAAAFLATGATFLTLLAGYPLTVGAAVALLAMLYVLGLRRPRRVALPVALPFIGYAAVVRSGLSVLLLGVALAALLLGQARRLRGELRQRAASDQVMADSLVEHAARGERARIARELHDVVAHHISMIAVQAETARLTTAGLPEEGAQRFSAIGDTARTALTEMRRLLGVLREDAGTTPTRRPQPSLQQLNQLIDEARASAGASTRLIVHGHVAPLDPGVELTAYRIVQEALTNARRHARGAAVDVELDYAADALRVRVRDNGPGPPPGSASGGHGLLGMRERAAMVGGTLHTGPAPASGFLVEAVLPLGSAEVAPPLPTEARLPLPTEARLPLATEARLPFASGEAT
ncbi:sensor histidine kinase [Phytohabitans sp. ZYX-F-186]|uniref:histidine kinase n=1 Tax=Phytohabitans maris TaxID=3071409 RepID=A0ABU0ZKX1_9ACTN|nr:sensor histidine kinase [Phytohabitans sp. ZYX-F-186]MDQ7907692.1 sensor histidine kinase [Phytohabitans sp. ZYX-F-186]